MCPRAGGTGVGRKRKRERESRSHNPETWSDPKPRVRHSTAPIFIFHIYFSNIYIYPSDLWLGQLLLVWIEGAESTVYAIIRIAAVYWVLFTTKYFHSLSYSSQQLGLGPLSSCLPFGIAVCLLRFQLNSLTSHLYLPLPPPFSDFLHLYFLHCTCFIYSFRRIISYLFAWLLSLCPCLVHCCVFSI